MNERTAKRLLDAHTACTQIESLTYGFGLEGYEINTVLQLATERLLEIVGEALNAASREAPELLGIIPDIGFAVGLRNKIAHDYEDISNRVIWDTVVNDIPNLRSQIELAMRDAPPL